MQNHEALCVVQHQEALCGKVRQILDVERSPEKMLSVVELWKWGFLEKMLLSQCCVNARCNQDVAEKGNKTGKK